MLPPTAQTVGLFSPTAGLWNADLNGNVIDVLAIDGSAEAFKLAVPVATTPVAVVGLGSLGQHLYSISQNVPFDVTCNNAPTSVATNGEADALEVASFTVSVRIPVGVCPVYGVASADGRRVFVLNRGSDTVTVINSQDNTLDQCTPFTNQNGQLVTCHPTLPLSTAAGLSGANVPSVAGPVYAEYIPTTQELVVADYDGGTISLIDVSLDESETTARPSEPRLPFQSEKIPPALPCWPTAVAPIPPIKPMARSTSSISAATPWRRRWPLPAIRVPLSPPQTPSLARSTSLRPIPTSSPSSGRTRTSSIPRS